MRPIDADAPRKKLVDWLSWYTGSEAVKGVVQEVVEILDDAPTLDVEPVRHGRWDENGRCTVCGGHAPYWAMASTYHKSPYCFECGAKMDAKED